MSLWTLLLGFSFVMPLSGAMVAARREQATWTEYAAGIVLALIVGSAFVWVANTAGRFVNARVAGRPPAAAERLYRWLYLGAAVWVIVGMMAGEWLAQMLFRLM